MWKILAFRKHNAPQSQPQSHQIAMPPSTPVVEPSADSGRTVYYTPYSELSSSPIYGNYGSPNSRAFPSPKSPSIIIGINSHLVANTSAGVTPKRINETFEKAAGSPRRSPTTCYTRTPQAAVPTPVTTVSPSKSPLKSALKPTSSIKPSLSYYKKKKKSVFSFIRTDNKKDKKKNPKKIIKVVAILKTLFSKKQRRPSALVQYDKEEKDEIFLVVDDNNTPFSPGVPRTPPPSQHRISFHQHITIHTPGEPTMIDNLKPCSGDSNGVRSYRSTGTSKKSVARSLIFDDNDAFRADATINSTARRSIIVPGSTPPPPPSPFFNAVSSPNGRDVFFADRPPTPQRNLPAADASGGPVRPMHCLLRRVNPFTLSPVKNMKEKTPKRTTKKRFKAVVATLIKHMNKSESDGCVDDGTITNGGGIANGDENVKMIGRTRSMIAATLPPAILSYSDDILRAVIENVYRAEQSTIKKCMNSSSGSKAHESGIKKKKMEVAKWWKRI